MEWNTVSDESLFDPPEIREQAERDAWPYIETPQDENARLYDPEIFSCQVPPLLKEEAEARRARHEAVELAEKKALLRRTRRERRQFHIRSLCVQIRDASPGSESEELTHELWSYLWS